MEQLDFAQLPFPMAFRVWIDSRKKIGPATRADYESAAKRLLPFFGGLRLAEIHYGHISEYIKLRLREGRGQRGAPMGPTRINREIGLLKQMLDRVGLWDKIKPLYERLPMPDSPGIALTPEEEQHLFHVAASRPRWLVAYSCSLLARNTCAGPGEILQLRLKHVDLEQYSWIRIEERVKNRFRIRTLECNNDAAWALGNLVDRCRRLLPGPLDPDWFLLPHRGHGQGADPTRHMKSWETAWSAMRRLAGERYPRIARMRFYDWRHTGCTNLLADPTVPYNVIEHYMGHALGSNVKRRYDHLRDHALKLGARKLASGHVERRRVEEILEPVLPKPSAAVGATLNLVQNTVQKRKTRP